jgi:hypothetical protein
MNQEKKIEVIKNAEYLQELVDSGFKVIGPRNDEEKDLKSLSRFFKRGIEIFPEEVLAADGFEIVRPSSFTNNHQLMFKDDGVLVRYTLTQYKLTRDQESVNLYVLLDEEKATF